MNPAGFENEAPSATILRVEYVLNGQLIEVSTADSDVDSILWAGPGMVEIHRPGGVVDSVVSDQMMMRAKVDQTKKKKIIVPDQEIALVS